MQTVIQAFLLIFMAELGDKSMLLAMTFATRFPLKQVIPGIFLGILANHGIAVLIGSQAGRLLPTAIIAPLSGLLFLIFALTNLKTEDEEEEVQQTSNRIWLAVAAAFFIGEFGDKTQISAMTLASQEPALLVLLGTVTAMMCTSLLSIVLGTKLGEKIPEFQMRIASGLVFLFFGLTKLREVLAPALWIGVAAVAIGLFLILALRLHRASKAVDSELRRKAELLKQQQEALEKATNQMCLGQGICGKCDGAACMVGYAKLLLQQQSQQPEPLDVHHLIQKEYPKETVEEGLALIVQFFKDYGWDENKNSLQQRTRQIFEMILFGHTISAESFDAYQRLLMEEKSLSDLPRLRNIVGQTGRTNG